MGHGRSRVAPWVARLVDRTVAAAVATVLLLVGTAVAPSVVPTVPAGAATRSIMPVTVPYGGDPLQFNVIFKGLAPDSPMAMLVPAAGFRSNPTMATKMNTRARYLLNAGYAVFTPSYRDNEAQPSFPAQVDDLRAAVRFVIDHAAQYNADPARLHIIGGSAGGCLAALVAESFDLTSPGLVRTVSLLSATTDFPRAIEYWTSHGGAVGSQHLHNIADAFGVPVGSTGSIPLDVLRQWSPDWQVTPREEGTRWMVINGEKEEQELAQADRMTNALRSVGALVTETIRAGTQHGYAHWNAVKASIVAFMDAAG
jgi:acetyl esterase/lipase